MLIFPFDKYKQLICDTCSNINFSILLIQNFFSFVLEHQPANVMKLKKAKNIKHCIVSCFLIIKKKTRGMERV